MKKLSLHIILFCLWSSMALGQSVRQWVKYGELSFDEGDYYGASVYYGNAVAIDSSKLELLFHYAEALRLSNDYVRAAHYYKSITKEDKKLEVPLAMYWLGEMQKHAMEYHQAKKSFGRFMKVEKNRRSYYYRKAKRERSSCNAALDIAYDTADVELENLGMPVNSINAEFSPYLTKDSIFYFTSLRNDSIVMKYREGEDLFTRLYKAKFLGDTLVDVMPLDSVINASSMHVANVSINNLGNQLFFSQCPDGICAIYTSKFEHAVWSIPEKMNSKINTEGFSSTQPFIVNVDEKRSILFFASERPRGRGGMDIWYSIGIGGNFGRAKNLGSRINSAGDELSPFYDNEKNELYFSSNWHDGLGGLDIFRARGTIEKFADPKNLGQPFNSSVNDLYYMMSEDRQTVFLTSNRSGSLTNKSETCCNDIYYYQKEKPILYDSIGQVISMIQSLEELNNYLPVSLYFHNDVPDPRSWETSTAINYAQAYISYDSMRMEYLYEYGQGLSGVEKLFAEDEINDLFNNYLEKGFFDLKFFTELMIAELERGQKIELGVKGFASPLADTDYNVNLTLRRISSLENYFYAYEDSLLAPYLNSSAENGGLLKIVDIPFGEYVSDDCVSDNCFDKQNSIFSPEASKERKIEIVSVSQAHTDSIYASFSFENEVLDWGDIEEAKVLVGHLKFKNIGESFLVITQVEVEDNSVEVIWPTVAIEPGEEGEIEIIFDTTNLHGMQMKTIRIISNAIQQNKTLSLTAEVVN